MTDSIAIPGRVLKSLSLAVKALHLENLRLNLEPAGVRLLAFDPAHCMAIEAIFPLPAPVQVPTTVYTGAKAFMDAAKPFYDDESINVEMKGAMLILKVGRRRRTLPTIDPRNLNEKELAAKVPRELPWAADFIVETEHLRRCLKDSSGIGADDLSFPVALRAAGGELVWSKGKDGGDQYENSAPVECASEAHSEFGDDYLSSAIGTITSEKVRIQLGTNLPLAMHYEIDGGTAFCLVAPRIEEE